MDIKKTRAYKNKIGKIYRKMEERKMLKNKIIKRQKINIANGKKVY